MNYLVNYDWPENVRELVVNSEEFKFNLNNKLDEVKINLSISNENISLELMEKQHIIKVLKDVKGNMTLAANILEIGRNTLYRKIEKYNIDYSKIEHYSEMKQFINFKYKCCFDLILRLSK